MNRELTMTLLINQGSSLPLAESVVHLPPRYLPKKKGRDPSENRE